MIEALPVIMENLHFAWSNIYISLLLLFFAVMAFLNSRNDGERGVDPLVLAFLFLAFVNCFGIMFHSLDLVEKNEKMQRVFWLLVYLSFTGIGFASLFLEFHILRRARVLAKHGVVLGGWGVRGLKWACVAKMLLFQVFNFLVYQSGRPDFLYSIIDYSVSLLLITSVSIVVLRKRVKGLDLTYERLMLWGVGTMILASALQQSSIIRAVYSRANSPFFYYNDIYHLALTIPFTLFFLSHNALRRT